MDKFSAMQTFVRVVEAGTFTKAADLMDMPKPTVTRLIQLLEKQLETKLLHRTTRRVTVTPDGAAYYDRAVRLLGELDDLISDNVDCVVRGGTLTDPSLVARRVGEVHMVTCASPEYLKRHGVPKHPDDLEEGHTVVRFASPKTGRPFPFVLTRGDESIEVKARHLVSANDANACVTATLAGLGVSRVITFLAHPHIQSGQLQPILVEWTSAPAPVHVVYPPNRHLSLKVRVFVDWIAELFAKHELLQCKATLTAQGRLELMCPGALAAFNGQEEAEVV